MMAVTTSLQSAKQGKMRRPLHSVPEVPSSAEEEFSDEKNINSLRKSVSQRLREESSSAEANSSPLLIAAINGSKSHLQTLLKSYIGEIDAGDKIGRTPLMYSILGDQYECAEVLIKAGADVHKTDVDERTALHWASYQGSHKFIRLLLDKGAKAYCQDKEGRTPLHLALTHDNLRVMAKLLKHLKEQEIDCPDKNGMTPLHFAVFYDRHEQTKLLLHSKASPDCQDYDKKTVLHWAKENKSLTIVRILMNYEPVMLMVNSKDSEGRTALHLAVAAHNKEFVEYLISFEDYCSLSEQDHMLRTPLHWAAILGHTDLVELLLSRDADYSIPDKNGVRPLHLAAQGNFAKTVTVMLQHERVKDIPDLEGRTTLMWAAAKGAFSVLQVLINHKQDVFAADHSAVTALHMAVDGGHLECVKELIRNKASVNAPDSKQHTPLFCACQMGHKDIAEYLLKHGATVDLEDKEGRTPLHWAAVGGRTVICRKLLSCGLSANRRDKLGRPALHYAAYGGFHGCISLLLESGVDVNAQDKTGVTALHWACASGSLDTVKLLFRYNAFPNFIELEGERLTPLDYAIIRDHQDVAQFMMEHCALTMAGIQELAATEIQRVWRGHQLRKTFTERKELYKIHEEKRKQMQQKHSTTTSVEDEPIEIINPLRIPSSHKQSSRNRFRQEDSYDAESDISRESELSHDSLVSRDHVVRRNYKSNHIDYSSHTETDDDLYSENEKFSTRNDGSSVSFGKGISYHIMQDGRNRKDMVLHGKVAMNNKTSLKNERIYKGDDEITLGNNSSNQNIRAQPEYPENWDSSKRNSATSWHSSGSFKHAIDERLPGHDIDRLRLGDNEMEISNETDFSDSQHLQGYYDNDAYSVEYSQHESVSSQRCRSSSMSEKEAEIYDKEMHHQRGVSTDKTREDSAVAGLVAGLKSKESVTRCVTSSEGFDSGREEQFAGIIDTKKKQRSSVLNAVRFNNQKAGKRYRPKDTIEPEKTIITASLDSKVNEKIGINQMIESKSQINSTEHQRIQIPTYDSKVNSGVNGNTPVNSISTTSTMKPWQVYKQEQERITLIRRKTQAAITIQSAFRRQLNKNLPKIKRPCVDDKRPCVDDKRPCVDDKTDANCEDEIIREIAALLIQLEWRKYMKRKLVREKLEEQERIVVDDREDLRLLAARQKKPKVFFHPHTPSEPKSRTLPSATRYKSSPKGRSISNGSNLSNRTTSFPLLHQGLVTANSASNSVVGCSEDRGKRRSQSEIHQKTASLLGRRERSSPQILLNKEQSRSQILPPKRGDRSLNREKSNGQMSTNHGNSTNSSNDWSRRNSPGSGKSHPNGTAAWSSNMHKQNMDRTYR